MFCKKRVLRNITKFTGKHLRQSLCSCEFCEISKNTFSTEHLRTTASGLKNITTQISHHSTFHFLRYAHFSCMKCLFTSMQKQVAYFLRVIQNLWTNSSIVLGDLECDIFRVLFFYEHKHMEIFKSALVYL